MRDGSRRRFLVFTAVSRLLMTRCPSLSVAAATGDIWGIPSARKVARIA